MQLKIFRHPCLKLFNFNYKLT